MVLLPSHVKSARFTSNQIERFELIGFELRARVNKRIYSFVASVKDCGNRLLNARLLFLPNKAGFVRLESVGLPDEDSAI